MTKRTKAPAAVRRMKALAKPKTGKSTAPRPNSNTLPAPPMPDADAAQIFAQIALHPTLQAANTIGSYRRGMDGSEIDLETSVAELTKQVVAVRDGDLERPEAMLISQAHALDAIFGNLARRAAVQEYLPQIDTFLRLALKAQSQCRATLETLAVIKNPPNVAFVRQANIAAGPQQVNNGLPVPSRALESDSLQNKLLEAHDGERLDIGTKGAASGANRRLAPLVPVNRTANGRRQGKG